MNYLLSLFGVNYIRQRAHELNLPFHFDKAVQKHGITALLRGATISIPHVDVICVY
jgi:hypothetical protein